jgi:hypothetical protein
VPAEVFEEFRVQRERTGQMYLDSFCVAELHAVGRVEQQPTRLNELSERPAPGEGRRPRS